MPVATQAAIKGLTPQQMEGLGVTLILNNTYHLNLRPGLQVLKEAGGAHRFQNWNRNLLTVNITFIIILSHLYNGQQDSGGFQLVSLSKFTSITEEGALFSSPFTGDPTMLTVCRQHTHNAVPLSCISKARREHFNSAYHRC
jgi:queuine tRNA-ribosyltransferase catalytic subunit